MLPSILRWSARARTTPAGDAIARAGQWATRRSSGILHARLVSLWRRRAAELLASESPPGCVCCIATARDGAPPHSDLFALGLADAALGTPLTPDTPFRGASLAKPFVALAALSLVRDRLLDLDAPVHLRLDARPIHRDGSFADPTLRQLLTHTSGLTVHSLPQTPAGEPAPDFAALLLDPSSPYHLRQVHEPGAAVLYSGGAFYLVGRALEERSGTPIAELVRARVLAPLGMTSTALDAAAQCAPLGCREHAPDRTVLPRAVAHAVGSGGLVTTGRDMARFVAAMLPSGPNHAPFHHLLGDAATELLRPCGPPLANPIYSLGFRIRRRAGGCDLSHGGIRDGTRAVAETIACGAAAVFCLANGEAGFRTIGPLIGESKALTVRAGIRGRLRPLGP